LCCHTPVFERVSIDIVEDEDGYKIKMAESHHDDYVSRELFGGAMTVDMPVGFEDVRYVV
jgi:hypothetical protein